MMMMRFAMLVLGFLWLSGVVAMGDEVVVSSFAESTAAPHGRGNVYAPDIVFYEGEFLMFFGGQGADGHDRIHLATSKEGESWEQAGVVFAPEGVNHVNDPSVVKVDGVLFLFYTLAGSGVTDSIGLATSVDGRKWQDRKAVFLPSAVPGWDSLLVGRPSVLHDGERFHLWYDGRKDLPPGAPDATAPKSDSSRRFVGYATSADGMKWERWKEPVMGEDAGGIHVLKMGGEFVMVSEARDGTRWAKSWDGIRWEPQGLLHAKDDDSPHGHVTPFLVAEPKGWRLFYGAARAATWDENLIRRAVVAGGGGGER